MTEKTLANWRSLGLGPAFIRVGEGRTARVAYRLRDLDLWLDAHLVAPGRAVPEATS